MNNSSPSITKLSRPLSRLGRRSQHGAALVEAAFMMPMFVLLFYASMYAYNLPAAYINMSKTARQAAWTYSMANCGETGNDTGDDVEVLPQVDTSTATKVAPMPDNTSSTASTGGNSVSSELSGLSNTIFGDISNIVPNPDGASSQQTTTLNWRMPNLYNGSGTGFLGTGIGGGNTTTVVRAVTIDCNNVPNDGGAVNTVILIGKSIASFF